MCRPIGFCAVWEFEGTTWSVKCGTLLAVVSPRAVDRCKFDGFQIFRSQETCFIGVWMWDDITVIDIIGEMSSNFVCGCLC